MQIVSSGLQLLPKKPPFIVLPSRFCHLAFHQLKGNQNEKTNLLYRHRLVHGDDEDADADAHHVVLDLAPEDHEGEHPSRGHASAVHLRGRVRCLLSPFIVLREQFVFWCDGYMG